MRTTTTARHWFTRLLLLELMTLVFWLSAKTFWSNENNISIAHAPNTYFATITGERIALSSLRGKTVLVTFWATNCASCIKDMPHLIELYNSYHGRGLEIIAVAMPYDPPNHVLDMAKARQLPYNVALDLYGENTHAFGDVFLTPTTFLIAPDGAVVLQKIGTFTLDEMKAHLATLLTG